MGGHPFEAGAGGRVGDHPPDRPGPQRHPLRPAVHRLGVGLFCLASSGACKGGVQR